MAFVHLLLVHHSTPIILLRKIDAGAKGIIGNIFVLVFVVLIMIYVVGLFPNQLKLIRQLKD